MKTLKQELSIRTVDCHVTTSKNWYVGLPRDLLKLISEEELKELVVDKHLTTCYSSTNSLEKQWELVTNLEKRF